MDKFFRRSMNKKGFTMVELIVVIAIIGVLAALVIPNLFASDVGTKGKACAKAYYFSAQEFFSRQKIAENPNAPSLSAVANYFYTTVDGQGRAVESGTLPSGSPNTMNSADVIQAGSTSNEYKKIVADFENYMEKNLEECDYEGTYYLVVDNNYRVQAAYWSEATIGELLSDAPTLLFADDDVISGYWCCAYPPELSSVAGVSDRAMFKYLY